MNLLSFTCLNWRKIALGPVPEGFSKTGQVQK